MKKIMTAILLLIFIPALINIASADDINDTEKGLKKDDPRESWIEPLSFDKKLTKPGAGSTGSAREREDAQLEESVVVNDNSTSVAETLKPGMKDDKPPQAPFDPDKKPGPKSNQNNLQYLNLQGDMAEESKQFKGTSDAMSQQHDEAKESVQDIKGEKNKHPIRPQRPNRPIGKRR